MIQRPIKRLAVFPLAIILILLSSIPHYDYVGHKTMRTGLQQARSRRLWDVDRGVANAFMPILMPVCKRPEYLIPVLEGLRKVQDIDKVCMSSPTQVPSDAVIIGF